MVLSACGTNIMEPQSAAGIYFSCFAKTSAVARAKLAQLNGYLGFAVFDAARLALSTPFLPAFDPSRPVNHRQHE